MTTRCKAVRDSYIRMCYAQASRLNCYPIGAILAILAIVVIIFASQHEKGIILAFHIVVWSVLGIICAGAATGLGWLAWSHRAKQTAALEATASPVPEPELTEPPATWPFAAPGAQILTGTLQDSDPDIAAVPDTTGAAQAGNLADAGHLPIADLPITAAGTRTAGGATATAYILTEDGVTTARNGARS